MIGLGGAADDFNLMDGAPLLLCLTVLQAAFVCSLLIFLVSFGSGAVGFDDELQESGGFQLDDESQVSFSLSLPLSVSLPLYQSLLDHRCRMIPATAWSTSLCTRRTVRNRENTRARTHTRNTDAALLLTVKLHSTNRYHVYTAASMSWTKRTWTLSPSLRLALSATVRLSWCAHRRQTRK